MAASRTSAQSYLSAADFVSSSFEETPAVSMFWLTREHQQMAESIMGHAFRGLRVRYWTHAERTAWIIDEIGKERPITIGVVIEADVIKRVEILDYREIRGGEVRHAFFTRQFLGAQLAPDFVLSKNIDGISGATLSVRAVTNVSRLALYLHTQTASL